MSEELLKLILEELKGIKAEQTKTNERLTNIEAKEDLDYFDKKISQHEREIFKLKNRA